MRLTNSIALRTSLNDNPASCRKAQNVSRIFIESQETVCELVQTDRDNIQQTTMQMEAETDAPKRIGFQSHDTLNVREILNCKNVTISPLIALPSQIANISKHDESTGGSLKERMKRLAQLGIQ